MRNAQMAAMSMELRESAGHFDSWAPLLTIQAQVCLPAGQPGLTPCKLQSQIKLRYSSAKNCRAVFEFGHPSCAACCAFV